jgi:hypothetical protein
MRGWDRIGWSVGRDYLLDCSTSLSQRHFAEVRVRVRVSVILSFRVSILAIRNKVKVKVKDRIEATRVSAEVAY